MLYDELLAIRIRNYFTVIPDVKIEEKVMFGCLTFMINGKMCVSVSGDEMMVRFDPALQEMFWRKEGFRIIKTKNDLYKGHGYISPQTIRSPKVSAFWLQQCLDFDLRAKASGKKKQ